MALTSRASILLVQKDSLLRLVVENVRRRSVAGIVKCIRVVFPCMCVTNRNEYENREKQKAESSTTLES